MGVATDDGPGAEGAFAITSFWLISALACAPRAAGGKTLFARMHNDAGPLGLYAEKIEPGTDECLGNHPQAFTQSG